MQSPESTLLCGAAAVLLLFLLPLDADAQMFSYGGERSRAVQSVSVVYKMVDFNFDGESSVAPTFDFAGPAYGILYTRPNVTASITYGPESDDAERDLRLLDATIMTWGEIVLTGSPASGRLFVPIAIQTDYRRVAPRGSEDSILDSFNVTVLGLGTGLGFSTEVAGAIRFEGRALPFIGLALRSFGDSTGSSYLLDSGARVQIMDLVGRVGLSFGYAFRAQVWNVDGSELLAVQQDDLLDYSGSQHVLSIGINW